MSNNENVILNSFQIILSKIKESGPISKQELKKNTGLSWAAVSTAVNELVENGYVIPYCKQQSQGPGRKAEEYDITPHNNYFIGVDFNDKGMLCVVTDLKGRVIKQIEKEFTLRERDCVLDELFEVVDAFFNEYKDKQILGIGIGVQGVVDVMEGTSVYITKIKDWNHVPLKQLFKERYGVEVCVLHDPDCLIKSEIILGCLKGKSVSEAIMININFRVGIGMAIMINGQTYHGVHGKAGEIGYTIVQNTPGDDRFLEEHVIREAIVKAYACKKNDGEKITYNEFAERLKNGDPICRSVYEELGKKIGFAISSACTFFDPESLVIHLDSCACPEVMYQIVSDFVRKNIYDKTIEINRSELGNNAIAIGSALTVIEDAIQKM